MYDVQFSEAGTIDLINKSKVIVTINSTVGFEALVYCKPVIITGNAFYEAIPFISKANNESEVTSTLSKFLLSDIKFDVSEVIRYISTVYNKLVKCNYVSPSEIDIYNLWKKISELHLFK